LRYCMMEFLDPHQRYICLPYCTLQCTYCTHFKKIWDPSLKTCLWTLSWESVGSSLFSGGGCTRGRLLCQTCTWNEEAFEKSSFIYGFSWGYYLLFSQLTA
jgi:hypothetical protein